MKVLAIIGLSETADRSQVVGRLNEELQESWELFAGGVIREAYMTDDPSRVAFVLETTDLAAAETALRRRPLVRGGQFAFQLIELRPFSNWARLFRERAQPTVAPSSQLD